MISDRRKGLPKKDPHRKPPPRGQGGLFGQVTEFETDKDEQERREGELPHEWKL